MGRILLVDDEPNILASLKRELRKHNDAFEIETCASAAEALERARATRYSLVITDYRMPEMDGVAFLDAFQKIQPDAARIMLSGQTDRDGLAASINYTHIHRFINKPWSEPELVAAVSQVLAYRKEILEHRQLAEEYRVRHGEPSPSPAAERRYQVLVLDDEENVLKAVARDLARESSMRLDVTTMATPREALEWAKHHACDLVITDYKMPEMNGIRFLELFRGMLPDAARILLSGQADSATLMHAINRAEIYSFIAKPWNEHELRDTAVQAIVYHDLLLENRRLAQALRFGSLPA